MKITIEEIAFLSEMSAGKNQYQDFLDFAWDLIP